MQMPGDFSWNQIAYWQHYKGGRYVLLDPHMAWLEEDYKKEDVSIDMQAVVLYRSLDKPTERPWVRRHGYFFGEVEVNGKAVPRFKPVTWHEAFLTEHNI